jgi:hypothetical protein
MEYLKFTSLFFVIHTIAYYVAGVINYQFSKKLYGGRDQLYKSFLRNMSDFFLIKKDFKNADKVRVPVDLVPAGMKDISSEIIAKASCTR